MRYTGNTVSEVRILRLPPRLTSTLIPIAMESLGRRECSDGRRAGRRLVTLSSPSSRFGPEARDTARLGFLSMIIAASLPLSRLDGARSAPLLGRSIQAWI